MAKKWVHESNCFLVRYTIDPARRSEFLQAVDDLLTFAASWYEEGAYFAFQGWARDPNVWVAIAAWKSEEILARLRVTPEFQSTSVRMLECCSAPMIMEHFSGMKMDRSVFDQYPKGSSEVHRRTDSLEVVFL